MAGAYETISVGGGDTSKPLAMDKRLRIIRQHIGSRGGRFLDCGCGAGEYVLALMELGLDAHGIEFDQQKVCRAHLHPRLRDAVTCGDLEAIDSPANAWDYALLNEVLEHVPDDRKALAEVFRVLKPKGLLFIFSPNRWFPFETHGVRIKGSSRRVPHWTPLVPYIPLPVGNILFTYWARNYWQGQLANMVRASGFSVLARGFIWMTFEDISGRQPWLIKRCKPWLRAISNTFEKCPGIKRFGVSQVLVCQK